MDVKTGQHGAEGTSSLGRGHPFGRDEAERGPEAGDDSLARASSTLRADTQGPVDRLRRPGESPEPET